MLRDCAELSGSISSRRRSARRSASPCHCRRGLFRNGAGTAASSRIARRSPPSPRPIPTSRWAARAPAFHAESARNDELARISLAGRTARQAQLGERVALLLIFQRAMECVERIGEPAERRFVDFVPLMAFAQPGDR